MNIRCFYISIGTYEYVFDFNQNKFRVIHPELFGIIWLNNIKRSNWYCAKITDRNSLVYFKIKNYQLK